MPLNTAYTRLRRLRADFQRALANEGRRDRRRRRTRPAGARRDVCCPDGCGPEQVRRATAAALAVVAAPETSGEQPSRAWPWAARIAAVGAVAVVAAGLGYGPGCAPRGRRLRASALPRPERRRLRRLRRHRARRPRAIAVRAPAGTRSGGDAAGFAPPFCRRGRCHPGGAGRLAGRGGAGVARRRARRREGNPGSALALLRELDRAVPNGQLVEERLATRTIARCAAGDVPIGVDLSDDFAARHPTASTAAASPTPAPGRIRRAPRDSAGRRPTQ